MKFAVKYCGGCNPRYNRKKVVAQLEEQLGNRLCLAIPGEEYEILYVICGCSVKCADITNLTAKQLCYIDDEREMSLYGM